MTIAEELIINKQYILTNCINQLKSHVEYTGKMNGYIDILYVFNNIINKEELLQPYLKNCEYIFQEQDQLYLTNEQFGITEQNLNNKNKFIIEEYYEDYACK